MCKVIPALCEKAWNHFFTGKNMLVDTAGRIDKFKKKYAAKK
jgi:ribosomal protein L31